jgi:hypothetical protein
MFRPLTFGHLQRVHTFLAPAAYASTYMVEFSILLKLLQFLKTILWLNTIKIHLKSYKIILIC